MTTKDEDEDEDENDDDDLQLLFPFISLFQLSVTDGRTDGRTDIAAYRDAETHLKTVCNLVKVYELIDFTYVE